MGVLQAAAAWIRQCIGIKKGVGVRSDESATGSTTRWGKKKERHAGVDIIAAWWRAIRGSLAIDLGY